MKAGQAAGIPRQAQIRRYLASDAVRISGMLNAGYQAFAGSPRSRFECARTLESMMTDSRQFAESVEEPTRTLLDGIANSINAVIESRRSGAYFNDFTVTDLESIRALVLVLVETLPEIGPQGPISEDTPTYFDVNLLAEHLERVAMEQGGNLAAFISTLGLRIRGMLADRRLGSVISRDPPTSFDSWLADYVGADGATNGPIAIIDLSLVPSEIIHIVIAVLARLIFEAMQRYRRSSSDGRSLPTVLVLEEAHTFVRKGSDEECDTSSPSRLCREIFERIARKGRKFGLGLVLSSQRPSELSPTVLAQCNTFLLHRIVNDSDQTLVSRLVPDNVGGLLRELPSLPSRQAILLGWAAPIFVLVEVDELPEEHRPHSADPDFWDVWTLKKPRPIDWAGLAADWTNVVDEAESDAPPDNDNLNNPDAGRLTAR